MLGDALAVAVLGDGPTILGGGLIVLGGGPIVLGGGLAVLGDVSSALGGAAISAAAVAAGAGAIVCLLVTVSMLGLAVLVTDGSVRGRWVMVRCGGWFGGPS